MPRHTGRILGSYLRDLFTSHGIRSFYRGGRAPRICCLAPCSADVMTHFVGLFYIVIERDAVAKFIAFFYIFVGYAAGSVDGNK